MEVTMKLSYKGRWGHENTKLGVKSKNPLVKARKVSALARLEQQLVDGTKTVKKGKGKVPLTYEDIIRIKSEIDNLKKKLKV